MSKTGVVLTERYRLDEPIAAGGVGQVWRASDLVLQRAVAVKLLRPEYAEHPETLERFRGEARHAGSLAHPCIAQVYDYCDGGPGWPPYLVMEYVNGPSLADVLAAEPVSAAYALDVIAKAATGLAAAHRAGLVHRDIKPGNILLARDGRVKITDFGIAHAAGSAPITDPGLVMGTTQYLAPERIAGAPATPASDLYSLGIVVHECLTGIPPFEGTPAEVMAGHLYLPLPPSPPDTPPEVDQLIASLTAKDPATRLADGDELATIARRLSTAIAAGTVMPPRQRPAPEISPVTGFPAAGDTLVLGTRPGSDATMTATLAGDAGPRDYGLRELGRSSGGSEYDGGGRDGTATQPHGAGDLTEDGPRTGGSRPGDSRPGGRAPERRLAVIGAAAVVLAAGGVAGWLTIGRPHAVPNGNHTVTRSTIGVVEPSTGPGTPGKNTHPSPGRGTATARLGGGSTRSTQPRSSATTHPRGSATAPASAAGQSPGSSPTGTNPSSPTPSSTGTGGSSPTPSSRPTGLLPGVPPILGL
ncbi:MAG TPA: protein kinase [Trebonia sp.]|nr:protein kinase [Trebonia sp.]